MALGDDRVAESAAVIRTIATGRTNVLDAIGWATFETQRSANNGDQRKKAKPAVQPFDSHRSPATVGGAVRRNRVRAPTRRNRGAVRWLGTRWFTAAAAYRRRHHCRSAAAPALAQREIARRTRSRAARPSARRGRRGQCRSGEDPAVESDRRRPALRRRGTRQRQPAVAATRAGAHSNACTRIAEERISQRDGPAAAVGAHAVARAASTARISVRCSRASASAAASMAARARRASMPHGAARLRRSGSVNSRAR